jgi:hypothetical protein
VQPRRRIPIIAWSCGGVVVWWWRGRRGAAVSQPPPQDMVQQLRDLAELKVQGILTEEEFAAQKARILNS